MGNVQVFVTECEGCGEEMESRTLNMTDDERIVVDFLDGTEFTCSNCGETTFIEVEKYQPSY